MAAVMILLEYLTDTAVSPLQTEFVELSEPYCSNVRTTTTPGTTTTCSTAHITTTITFSTTTTLSTITTCGSMA